MGQQKYGSCCAIRTTLQPHSAGKPLVVSGPSGVGKGTLVQKLFNTHPGTFGFTVSHTTRKPRPGEVEGVAYFFISLIGFSSLCSQGALYGTSKKTIEDQAGKGLVVVLDIEMQGVKQTKANPDIDARYVFIKPPGFEALEARLGPRGTENEEDVQRLAQARIIVNDDVERAYQEFVMFVFGPTARYCSYNA
ncbi:guanylate kinase [Aspergillus undulatus]|uniref:guanylate kinase n=1 Tax=Aspergillus undulatus TaxID=1810928 RepID=UPI003CCD2D4A